MYICICEVYGGFSRDFLQIEANSNSMHFHPLGFLHNYPLLLSRRGLNRAGVEAKAGQGWVWVKAAWGGQQAVRNLKRIFLIDHNIKNFLIKRLVDLGRPTGG